MRRIAAAWAQYHERVLPPDAGRIQVKESKRAFYAGAEAMIITMLRSFEPSTGPEGDEPTDADMAVMDELRAELMEFARGVGEGRE